MDTMGERPSVVIDLGSGTIKAGFGGEDTPRAVFPSVVGAGRGGRYVGAEAMARRSLLKMSYPVEHGVIAGWDDAVALLRHAFEQELRADPAACNVLVTEPPLNPQANRERLVQVLFDTFGVPACYLACTSVLALRASGCTTGLVVESGDDATYAVPVREGRVLPEAVGRLNLAGRDLTGYLVRLLRTAGLAGADRELARDIKEKVCYVSVDLEGEVRECAYALPDGNVFAVGNASFMCPEALFTPDLTGQDGPGLATVAHCAIQKADTGLRNELYGTIVLAGGSTMFGHLDDRLLQELTILAPGAPKISVLAPPERIFSAWIGGSILSTLGSFASQWITRAEYDRSGPAILTARCP
jgi:actin-related protein